MSDDRMNEIVGEFSGLRRTFSEVTTVASSDAPVVLLGETGTGKEVVARAIHERSKNPRGPFLRVNCGAIAPELIDAELFGHERGAFTGAIQARKGWFEQAHGGTLFLDEIGELAAAAQVRLLRVVQDGELMRVGGEKVLQIKVRIISATHQDLIQAVKEGRFREDLYYRIAVFPITLPPLRARTEDFEELATHFCKRASKRFGIRYVAPSPHDVNQLRDYRWPGNVREFAAVIDRAVLLGCGTSLAIQAALGQALRDPAPVQAAPVQAAPAQGQSDEPLQTLDEVDRLHIERTLKHCKGRVDGPFGAAQILGLNPHTLRGRMRKLSINWSQFRAKSS